MKTETVVMKSLFRYEGLKYPWHVIYPKLKSIRHFLISRNKNSVYRIFVRQPSADALASEFIDWILITAN